MAWSEPDVRVELEVGGAWVDITGDVRVSDGITVTRGRSDEGQHVDPSTCSMTLNNADGKYSPRNPNSPYYGLIGRNTPLRVSFYAGGTYLWLDALNNAIQCPDSSALSITGDIDVRVDADLDTWTPDPPWNLIGKADPDLGNSWLFTISSDGTLLLYWWYTSSLFLAAQSTVPVPEPASGRKRVRATLDVDNGSSGWTATFYIGDTLDGPWEQLGDAVTGSGTTQINDGSAPLRINPASDHSIYYEVRVYDGIDGTLVAGPDFTAQTDGATSLTDGQGNEWAFDGGGEITNRRSRFVGEVSEWPQRWDLSGRDVYVPIQASGIMRRLGQGASPLPSTMYQGVTSLSTPPVAYWPCEDEDGATQLASGLPGGYPMRLVAGETDVASHDGFVASKPVPRTGAGAHWRGSIAAYSDTGQVQLRFLLHVDEDASITDGATMLHVYTTGTITHWGLLFRNDGDGSFEVRAYDDDGIVDTSGTLTFTAGGSRGVNSYYSLELQNDGSDVDWVFSRLDQGAASGTFFSGTVSGRQIGRATRVEISPNRTFNGGAFGHITVQSEITSLFALAGQLNAYHGETAARRVRRLCEENGILVRIIGSTVDSAPMGYQQPAPLLDLLRECETTDLGILHEPRDMLGLAYRTRESRYNQTAAVQLGYATSGLVGLDPVDDDQAVRNDVTVTRAGGSSARAVLEDGPLSVQAPPDGIGRYDESVAINVDRDDVLTDHAGWRLHLGTVDEARYPQIQLRGANPAIAGDADQRGAVMRLDLGDRVDVTGLPDWLPPDDATQVVQGYSEALSDVAHDITTNCSPGSPWMVGVLGPAGEPAEFAAASTHVVNTTEITVPLPAGWEPGQLALLCVNVNDNAETLTGPTGWVVLDSGPVETGSQEVGVWWRILQEGDTDPTVTITAAQKISGAIVTYTGHDPYSPIAAVGTRGTRSSSSADVVAGSVTTTRNRERIVGFFCEKSSAATSVTLPASMTSRAQQYGSGGGATTVIVGDEVVDEAGESGTRTATYDISSGSGYGLLVAIRSTPPAAPERLDTAGSQLAADVDVDDTEWSVLTTSGPTWTEDHADMPILLRAGGEVVAVTEVTKPFSDAFDRTESGGWGSADTGQAWTCTDGTSADNFSVTGGKGRVGATATATRYFTLAGEFTDAVLTASITCDVLATGGNIQTGLIARAADVDTHYLCNITWTTAGTILLELFRRVSSTYTELADAGAVLHYAADDTVHAMFSVIGDKLQAKLWTAGSDEPAHWMIEATDSDIAAAGAIGTHTNLISTNNNAPPVIVDYDDIQVVTPQAMTVVRSANGVSKAHAAGTSVRLRDPFTLSL